MNLDTRDLQPQRLRLLQSMGLTNCELLNTIIGECAEYIDILQTRIQMLLESEEQK